MILGAFGDSFLYGSDLSDIQDHDSVVWYHSSKLTYPALIAKHFNYKYYCTALPAQGNKVIADDIIRAVSYHQDLMFYIINWTWIDRFEYIGPGRPGDCRGWCSTLPSQTDNESKFYYKHFYTDVDVKLSNLMYIKSALDCLLENNCKFIMTYMDHLLFDTEYNTTVSIEYLQNKIKSHCTNFNGMSFLEWSRFNKFSESNNWHPLEQAHQSAFKYWLPTVSQMLNTHATED